MKWRTSQDLYPEKDCQCLVRLGKHYFKIYTYNPYEQCWDDEDGDDYVCEIDEVKEYVPIEEVIVPLLD